MAEVVERPSIVLLNASYEPLSSNISFKKAARLLAKEKAVVVESIEGFFLGVWPFPTILRLVEFVKINYDKVYGPKKVSKRGVLLRDDYKCAYCGKPATTVDHIQPKSKSGLNDWLNLVAACLKCNGRKANRTPAEAGMKLLITPTVPKRIMYR